jgi:hypothetical protein
MDGGRFKVHGWWIKTDGTNDPTVTITDKNSDGSKAGQTLISGQTFDATQLALNGMTLPEPIFCNYGVSATVTISAGSMILYILYS